MKETGETAISGGYVQLKAVEVLEMNIIIYIYLWDILFSCKVLIELVI